MLNIEQYQETSQRDTYPEIARRGSELQFYRLLEKLPAGAYTCDPQGLITYYNSHAAQLWGREPKLHDPVDRYCGSFKLFSANDGIAIRHDQCWMALTLQSGNEYNGHEIVIERPDGRRLTVLAHANPIRNESGQLIGAMNVLIDISDRKRTEDLLKEADRYKNEFLATLAHELRNPLAPIYNAVRLLKSTSCSADQNWAIDVINRQTQQMTRLIDDLLDVGRINANLLHLHKERVKLDTLIETAVETSQPLIDTFGQELIINTPSQPIYLDADSARLSQVIANLLNNAAKYTERGGRIWLSAEQRDGEIVVSVRDSGIGISAKALPHIFEMFMQVPRAADETANQAEGGLGVGLTLAKRLVTMHGGTIAAYSEGLGKGSEFIVRLPAAITPPQDTHSRQTSSDTPAFRSLPILVVDDNRDTAASMGMLLQLMGHEIRTAHDGLDAVRIAEQFRPEVLLLDIGLPLADGYQAAKMIREQSWGKDMLLIAVTGWGQEADKRRTLEAGFNHHLVKPVDPATLTRLLASLQPRR